LRNLMLPDHNYVFYLVLCTLWSWVEKLIATWCCELCSRESKILMLPDHNMMFVARWTTKVRFIDVLLEWPSWVTSSLLISYLRGAWCAQDMKDIFP
jgi:hypothetical protein